MTFVCSEAQIEFCSVFRNRMDEKETAINVKLKICIHVKNIYVYIEITVNGLTSTTIVKIMCPCGSVVEHCISSAKVVGSIPREHTSHTDSKNL